VHRVGHEIPASFAFGAELPKDRPKSFAWPHDENTLGSSERRNMLEG
jgi:hypothetical protein